MSFYRAEITGVDKVVKALSKLGASTRKKSVSPSLRLAARPVRDQVIANIKSGLTDISTHTLERNIVIRSGSTRKSRPGTVRIVVVIKGKTLNPKNNQRVGLYGSVREYGKEGQPPKPAFRPAVSQKASEAINIFLTGAKLRLDEAVEDAKR